MTPYLNLLRHLLDHGEDTASRAVLRSTGGRPRTRSVFGTQSRYDLQDGFPLVTTKALPFRSIIVELLWFLSGSTNVRDLQVEGVHIWDEWANEAGELGPVYGKQWRRWDGGDGLEVDQVLNLVLDLRAVIADPTHPAARRMLLLSWNPADANAQAMSAPPRSAATPWRSSPSGPAGGCRATSRRGRATCSSASRGTSPATPC